MLSARVGSTFPRGSLLCEHGLDRARERLPLQPAHGKCLHARAGDPVDAAAASAHLRPTALDEAVAFEAMKGRVDGPFGQLEDILAPPAEPFDDCVAVQLVQLECGEDERVEMALEDLRSHYLATLYLALRGVNQARLNAARGSSAKRRPYSAIPTAAAAAVIALAITGMTRLAATACAPA